MYICRLREASPFSPIFPPFSHGTLTLGLATFGSTGAGSYTAGDTSSSTGSSTATLVYSATMTATAYQGGTYANAKAHVMI